MKHWRKRRHLGGSDVAPLTPAQVQALRDRQDAAGTRVVRLLVVALLIGAISHAALFAGIDSQTYRAIMLLSVLNAVVLGVSLIMIFDGHELAGVVVALVSSSLHILWVCMAISAGVSAESVLFPIALAPFVMVRRELPALRLTLSSFAIGVYLVCELAFPDGSGAHQLEGEVAVEFARSNRIVASIGILAIVAAIQITMSSTRRILEGAARYGELRATTDELTGVYNRRPIIAQLSQWAERGRGNYAIALIDLDHFKTINDEFGHDCGDTVIQAVALTLRSHFRESDMVSRWGGDEFLVLMPGVRHSDLLPVLDRLRQAINLIEKRCSDHVHHVTVSIGASMGAIGQTPDECIAAADHALYRAKEEGRNKVVAVGVSEPTHALGRPSPDEPLTPPAGLARRS
jgi:diguanylate cyclase (GGDEF)-like protein